MPSWSTQHGHESSCATCSFARFRPSTARPDIVIIIASFLAQGDSAKPLSLASLPSPSAQAFGMQEAELSSVFDDNDEDEEVELEVGGGARCRPGAVGGAGHRFTPGPRSMLAWPSPSPRRCSRMMRTWCGTPPHCKQPAAGTCKVGRRRRHHAVPRCRAPAFRLLSAPGLAPGNSLCPHACARFGAGIPWELTQYSRESYRVRRCLGS